MSKRIDIFNACPGAEYMYVACGYNLPCQTCGTLSNTLWDNECTFCAARKKRALIREREDKALSLIQRAADILAAVKELNERDDYAECKEDDYLALSGPIDELLKDIGK